MMLRTGVVTPFGAACVCAALLWATPLAIAEDRAPPGGIALQLSGHWVSTQHVTFTNASLAGSSFFLDIVIAKDGTFQGVWDAYSCLSYPGAYGTAIISCSRVQQPAKARGKFGLTVRSGEIELERLGRASFAYTIGNELLIELPRGWLKQGDPGLYTTKLVRPKGS